MSAIFLKLTSEIEKMVIDYSENLSLVRLSGVNKAANKILSNLFFKDLFDRQHPILERFHFEKLCSFFPDNYGKILCVAFSQGQLNLSQTFISENSPHIHKHTQSQRTQIIAGLKNICGRFYEDPNSPIDQAWKAKERIAQLQDAFNERQTPLLIEAKRSFRLLCNNFPELNGIEIFQTLSTFDKTLERYTDEEILNRNYEVTIAIHDEIFLAFRKKFIRESRNHRLIPYCIDPDDDESIRRFADNQIALRLPDLCTILSSENKFNSHTIRHISQLLTQVYSFSDQKGFEDKDLHKTEKRYTKLEENRKDFVNRLQIIEKELAAFDECGKITLSRTVLPPGPSGEIRWNIEHNHAIHQYEDVVKSEFKRARYGEIAVLRLPHLEDCLCLIQNLIENSEEISSDTLSNIRRMINACDLEDIDQIWGGLYDACANGVHEDRWAEIHFPEFLKPLEEIVYSAIVNYRFQRNCLGIDS